MVYTKNNKYLSCFFNNYYKIKLNEKYYHDGSLS